MKLRNDFVIELEPQKFSDVLVSALMFTALESLDQGKQSGIGEAIGTLVVPGAGESQPLLAFNTGIFATPEHKFAIAEIAWTSPEDEECGAFMVVDFGDRGNPVVIATYELEIDENDLDVEFDKEDFSFKCIA